MQKSKLSVSLGPWGAASLVVGTIIGTGIFLKTATMTQTLGEIKFVMLAWILAGILSYAGALSYAELMSRLPKAGGEYALLKSGWGERTAFLYGWMRFWIGSPGSIAAYAVGAATFLKGFYQFESEYLSIPFIALCFIIFFSLLNCFQLSFGSRVQTFLTFLKVFLIIGLVLGLFVFSPHSINETPLLVSFEGSFLSRFGLAMIAALWAFDGWNNLPMVAEEVKNPQKNIPIALGLGVLVVVILYLLVNASFFYSLTLPEIASANSRLHPDALPVATIAAQKILGSVGIPLLSIAFVISALGAMNGSILTSARIPFAMSRDGLFFKNLSTINNKTNVPVKAILTQTIIACLLALSGTFDQLTDYVVVSSWIFYALTTAILFKWRKENPQDKNIYRAPFYPVLPALFIGASLLLIANSMMRNPKEAFIGLGIILSGLPLYYYFSTKNRT